MSVMEKWQQIAIELGNGIYRSVNTPDMVGTDEETGYVLMFFNVKNHAGKSTLVSTNTDKLQLKRLLKNALRELDGKKTKIVPPAKYAN